MGATFDLLILGGGSAGFAAAIRAAELGAQVALAEGGTLGGTCVNVGCVPSKTLLRAAEARHRRVHHGFAGIPSRDGRPEWTAVRAQKDALVSRLRQTKYRDVLQAYDTITLFAQRGKLASARAVRLADGRLVTAGKTVVATGSSPWAPPIPGLAEAGYLDNASAMALDRLPDSLVVLGGGPVGLELAQMFARLGVRVTVLETLSRLLPAEDPEVGAALQEHLAAEGIEIRTGARVRRVDRSPEGYVLTLGEDGAEDAARADQLLVATGRRGNGRGLGLEAAGVELREGGEIVVDDFLRSAHPDVYAAGDVIGAPMLVYVAAHAGTIAAENALQGDTRRYDLAPLPSVAFTDPAVASVGRTEAQARASGVEPLVSRLALEHLPRALAAHDTRGFIKLVADPATRRILGAQILAAEAGEMIAEPALALRHGLTIDDLTAQLHPYLTLSEGIKLAALGFDKAVATLSCCAG